MESRNSRCNAPSVCRHLFGADRPASSKGLYNPLSLNWQPGDRHLPLKQLRNHIRVLVVLGRLRLLCLGEFDVAVHLNTVLLRKKGFENSSRLN